MKTKMKNNESGSTTGAGQIVIYFTISLLFSSVVISWMLLNAYGISVSGITLPELTSGTQIQDLSSSNMTTEEGGGWSYTTEGKTSTAENSYLIFKSVIPVDFKYINEYSIYNPYQKDYSVILEKSPSSIKEIIVKSDGFYIPAYNGDLLNGGTYYYKYPDANKYQNVKIKTVYFRPSAGTSNALKTDFYFNDKFLFSANGIGSYIMVDNTYYGGIGSKNNIGVRLNSYIHAAGDVKADDWLNLAPMFVSFLVTAIKVIVWNIDAQYFPIELNILLIKSQVFAIAIGWLMIGRG